VQGFGGFGTLSLAQPHDRQPGVARIAVLLLLGAVMLVGCRASPATAPTLEPPGGVSVDLQLTSSAFAKDEVIPARYTCDGQGVSPDLSWSAGPPGTTTYALVVDDPDAPAGTFVHWVAWNIPGTSLPEAVPTSASTPLQGTNGAGKPGYTAPCPPKPTGSHRYYFHVYALDTSLGLPPGAGKQDLLAAMQGHVLAKGELVGRYGRP
jgi:Raf kinase inhibitor-like YbhB/YbcL family protein